MAVSGKSQNNASTPSANAANSSSRALANGEVWIYKNGVLVTKVTLNAADQSFFNSKGGRVGVWYLNSVGSVFDDFGGGTFIP